VTNVTALLSKIVAHRANYINTTNMTIYQYIGLLPGIAGRSPDAPAGEAHRAKAETAYRPTLLSVNGIGRSMGVVWSNLLKRAPSLPGRRLVIRGRIAIVGRIIAG
jgi:hypothetical protein